MLYEFREYNDNEIPNFIWSGKGSDLESKVILGNEEICIKAINRHDIWHIKAKKKNGKNIMNLRLRNLTNEEVMIITETHLLDRYND